MLFGVDELSQKQSMLDIVLRRIQIHHQSTELMFYKTPVGYGLRLCDWSNK